MGSFTNYLEKKLLDHLFGISSYTAPSIYAAVGLYNGGTYTGWGETGTGGTEPPSADGYARVLVPTFDAITTELDQFTTDWRCYTKNTNNVDFGPATAVWGTDNPRFGAIFDAVTAGNCLGYLDLGTSSSHPSVAGKLLRIAAGEWRWYLEDTASIGAPKVFSLYTKQKLLEHFFGISAFTPPTALYLGILKVNLFTFGPPQTWVELDAPSYSRVACTSSWNAAVTAGDGRGMIDNNASISFPVAGEAWNGFGGYGAAWLALWDASTGGNVLMVFKDPSNNMPTINAGDQFVIPANYLQAYVN